MATKLQKAKSKLYSNNPESMYLALSDEELLEEARKSLQPNASEAELDTAFKTLRSKENKIGVAFNEDGGYYFRTFEASHNPKYLKEIEKANVAFNWKEYEEYLKSKNEHYEVIDQLGISTTSNYILLTKNS